MQLYLPPFTFNIYFQEVLTAFAAFCVVEGYKNQHKQPKKSQSNATIWPSCGLLRFMAMRHAMLRHRRQPLTHFNKCALAHCRTHPFEHTSSQKFGAINKINGGRDFAKGRGISLRWLVEGVLWRSSSWVPAWLVGGWAKCN